MVTKSADRPAPGWRFYFQVDRIKAAVTRIAERGGKVLMGPHQVPGGNWIVEAADPQGAEFAVLSMVE
jgi:predicted enzyme related to lactoylglutathione lyase